MYFNINTLYILTCIKLLNVNCFTIQLSKNINENILSVKI